MASEICTLHQVSKYTFTFFQFQSLICSNLVAEYFCLDILLPYKTKLMLKYLNIILLIKLSPSIPGSLPL